MNYFIECGAHEGSAALQMAKLGCHCIAIEANPHTYKIKTKNIQKKNLITLNVGLGETIGKLDFFIPSNNETAGNATLKPKENHKYDKIQTNITTLNNLSQEYGFLNKKVGLWLDVEGMAFEVLMGSKTLLCNDTCMIIKVELETIEHFKGQKTAEEVAWKGKGQS